MNVKSASAASALWTDQVSSTVSALEKSSDPTVSSFSKMLDQMMGENSQSAVSNAAQGASAAAKTKMKHVETLVSNAKNSAAASGASAADAQSVAQNASDQWMNKMTDRFTQTMESGANSTLLSQDQLMAI